MKSGQNRNRLSDRVQVFEHIDEWPGFPERDQGVVDRGSRGLLRYGRSDPLELKNAKARGELVEASAVEAELSGVLRTVRAGILAMPSRCAAPLPHLTPHDTGEIDAEVRAVLAELGNDG